MRTVVELIETCRHAYLKAFRRFIQQQRQEQGGGRPEVKFEVPDVQSLYRGLYCTDFANNHDGQLVACELQVDHQNCFEPVSCKIDEAVVLVESLNWGGANLHHDAVAVSDEKVRRWFDYWFDPADTRLDPTSEFCGIIHQLVVRPGLVSVDFGTAPADAICDMLELLGASGARHIRITSDDV